jgi:hypothetical protein
VEIFQEVFDNFIDRCGFSVKRGDSMHFVSGTECHTGWAEGELAARYDAYGATFDDELEMIINGRRIWWTHQGGAVGKGATEGDAYRNWLKTIYFDCEKLRKPKPDGVISSHYHKSLYQCYVRDWHTIHGIVTPSWQRKTRYAISVTPFQRNDIGLSLFTVTVGGDMRFERPLLLDPKKLK